MIDHVWTVVCSDAVIDQFSNNVSLHNVIEQVNVRREPEPGRRLSDPIHIMTLWVRRNLKEPSRGRARLAFVSPSGVVGDPIEYPVDLSENHRNRMRITMRGLPIEEPGRHAFRVELQNEDEAEWHEVAAIPLEVNFVPPEASEQAEDQPEQD